MQHSSLLNTSCKELHVRYKSSEFLVKTKLSQTNRTHLFNKTKTNVYLPVGYKCYIFQWKSCVDGI